MRQPSMCAMARFIKLWHQAQRSRNVERMEFLLQPRFLRFWWKAYQDANGPWKSSCNSAIEIILEKAELI